MYVGKIIFPIPEEEGLSYAAYLIYQSQTNMMSYYTIERNDSGEYPELCSYDLAGAMPTRESRGGLPITTTGIFYPRPARKWVFLPRRR